MTPEQIFDSATAAYERGRLKWAVISALPMAVIPLASFAVGQRLGSSMALGAVLLIACAVMLWRGQALSVGLSAGLKAGLVPLVLSHAANLYGHVCTPAGCTSLCVPACALGGVTAGVIVALAAARSVAPLKVLGAGAATACLVGAFGCSCVGFSGVAGMLLGTGAAICATRLCQLRRA